MQPARDAEPRPAVAMAGGRSRAVRARPQWIRMKSPKVSDAQAARAHRADAVEFGLLARILGDALAHLVALVQQLDLLQLLERLGERIRASSSWPFSSSAERLRLSRRAIAALA